MPSHYHFTPTLSLPLKGEGLLRFTPTLTRPLKKGERTLEIVF